MKIHTQSLLLLSAFCCLCFLTPAVRAEEIPAKADKVVPEPTKPLDIIEKQGALALVAGGNYYIFEKNGVFRSGPLGRSGRTFFGFWKSNSNMEPMFEVVAQRGWVNGSMSTQDYNRLSFYIGSGTAKEGFSWFGTKKPILNGYWFINALEKAEKPADFDERKAKARREQKDTPFFFPF